jgi:dihydrofolate reductase
MAKLIYFTPTSRDGYIADENYDCAAPDEEGFAFINELERPIGTYLYGRKMYETMAIWETPDIIPGRTPAMLEFARIWQAADKIVYSKSLETVSTPKTHLEREFDPQAIRNLKAQLPHDVSVGGPTLPHTRSGSGSSTSINCWSCLLCLAAASGFCPAMYP